MEIIKKYRSLFITNRIKLVLHDLDYCVVTDKTLNSLLIEQLISNSTKYAKGETVEIYFDSKVSKLVIYDSGIGIKE